MSMVAAVGFIACSDDAGVAEPSITVSGDHLAVPMEGTRQILEIDANTQWRIACDEDWCRPNVTVGSHRKKIVVTVDPNPTTEVRTATLRLSADGEELRSVRVEQAELVPAFELAQNGQTFKVFGTDAEPLTLSLKSNVPWETEGATDWCAVSPASGAYVDGTVQTISVMVSLPDVTEKKAATLTFKGGYGMEAQSVTVIHDPDIRKMKLMENGYTYRFDLGSHEQSLTLDANVEWHVEGMTDWCTVSQDAGDQPARITVRIASIAALDGMRTATLSFVSDAEGTETQRVTFIQRNVTEQQQAANTVLVRTGQTVSFPAARPDGQSMKGTSIDWIWATSSGLLPDMAYDAASDRITVTAGDTPGSQLVALFDEAGRIAWSWLVWVVDDANVPQDLAINGITWMDRNLGAETLEPYYTDSNKEGIKAYGYYYQWGRKEPFVGPRVTVKSGQYENADNAFRSMTREVVFNPPHATAWTVEDTAMTEEAANTNPTVFYTQTAVTDDVRIRQWNSQKGYNDPCPAGYRIPTVQEWQSMVTFITNTANATKTEGYGITYSRKYTLTDGSGTFFVAPSTMFRNGTTGGLHLPGRAASYCASTLLNGKLWVMHDWNVTYGGKADQGNVFTAAHGMRCIKEK